VAWGGILNNLPTFAFFRYRPSPSFYHKMGWKDGMIEAIASNIAFKLLDASFPCLLSHSFSQIAGEKAVLHLRICIKGRDKK